MRAREHHNGPPPLIVTLQLDAASHGKLTALRTRYFPKDRNFLEAHVTYAQSLPSEKAPRFRADLENLAGRTSPFPVGIGRPFSMGRQVPARAVGISINSPQVVSLRARLIRRWNSFDDIELSNQDLENRKTFHVTVSNKDTPENAQRCLDELLQDWHDWEAQAVGLELYEYQRTGHWKFLQRWPFTGAPTESAVQ